MLMELCHRGGWEHHMQPRIDTNLGVQGESLGRLCGRSAQVLHYPGRAATRFGRISAASSSSIVRPRVSNPINR